MRNVMSRAVCGLLVALSLGATPALAASSDETRLNSTQRDIDKEFSANKNDEARIQKLAKEFNVPPATVQDLRARGQGWGEVTIELSMARQLAKSDPKTYPTFNDALKKIETMRGDKMGWGKIANDLGFKLGPVVSETQRARREMAASVRAERRQDHGAGRPDKHDKPEKMNHGARPDHTDRPGKPEKTGKN